MSEPERNRPGLAERPDAAGPVDLEERKERVLHTRVPESLDRHIKRRARSLGLSVSTVVRNVLLNTFGLVEGIVTDSANLAFSIAGHDAAAQAEPERARAIPADDPAPAGGAVLGWQEAVLNVNATCDRCNAVLRRGMRAAIAVRERPGPRAFLCPRCLGILTTAAREAGARAARRRR